MQLKVDGNHFTGDLVNATALCHLTALQFLYLSSNSFDGTLPPCLYNGSATLTGLQTLTVACQFPDGQLKTTLCPNSFGLVSEGNSSTSALTLLRSVRTLARTDLPLPMSNLGGTASRHPPPLKSTRPRVSGYIAGTPWNVSTFLQVLFLLLPAIVIALLKNGLCRSSPSIHRWRTLLRSFDRFPQKGTFTDRIFSSKGFAVKSSQPEPFQTARGGVATIIQFALIGWYILLGVQSNFLENAVLGQSTSPTINFLPNFALNFSVSFERTTIDGGFGPMPIMRVNDSWLLGTLQRQGLTHDEAVTRIHRRYLDNASGTYTFPLGFGQNGLDTVIDFYLPSSDSGFTWQLSGGGVIKGDPTGVSYPQVSGAVFAVPSDREVCNVYSLDAIFCEGLGAARLNEVPGRSARTAIYGPNYVMCLEQVNLEIQATPLTEVNDGQDADGFWIWLHPTYLRQYFLLSLARTRPTMNLDKANKANWWAYHGELPTRYIALCNLWQCDGAQAMLTPRPLKMGVCRCRGPVPDKRVRGLQAGVPMHGGHSRQIAHHPVDFRGHRGALTGGVYSSSADGAAGRVPLDHQHYRHHL